jgi:hypothetical protein
MCADILFNLESGEEEELFEDEDEEEDAEKDEGEE